MFVMSPEKQILHIANLETRLLDLDKDIKNLEKWFDNRKFVLERVYRASLDGYKESDLRPKLHMKEHFLLVVESEHGKIFGGYSSLAIVSTITGNTYAKDSKAFVFSLTQ